MSEKEALEQFTAYFVENYPGPDTIIHKPEWHAPKIFNAARRALDENCADLQSKIADLQSQLAEESKTVDLVWKALGIETYEQAKPYTISEHVANLRQQLAEEQQRANEESLAHEHIAKLCFNAGATTDDGTSVSAVRNLVKLLAEERARMAMLAADECDGAQIEGNPEWNNRVVALGDAIRKLAGVGDSWWDKKLAEKRAKRGELIEHGITRELVDRRARAEAPREG